MNIIPNPISAIDKATITEHICVAKIKKLGYNASIVHMKAADIIMDVNGTLLRVQVKSSRLKTQRDGNRYKTGYQFSTAHGSKFKTPITSKDCDIIAFVAFEIERILFMHISVHNQETLSKRLSKNFFNDSVTNTDIEESSLTESLKIHKEMLDV